MLKLWRDDSWDVVYFTVYTNILEFFSGCWATKIYFSHMICLWYALNLHSLVKIVCLLSFFSISGFGGFYRTFYFDSRAPFHLWLHLKFIEYGKPDDMSLVFKIFQIFSLIPFVHLLCQYLFNFRFTSHCLFTLDPVVIPLGYFSPFSWAIYIPGVRGWTVWPLFLFPCKGDKGRGGAFFMEIIWKSVERPFFVMVSEIDLPNLLNIWSAIVCKFYTR